MIKEMNVLVACEESQEVAEAFIKRGHNAWSCDKYHPGAKGLPHYQGDVRDIIHEDWDLIIAHPTCTRIANSGVLRLYVDGKKKNGIDPVKWEEMREGAEFFKLFMNLKCEKVVAENPIPHKYALEIIGCKYDQIIQPYQFGEDASKATCLWLKGVPKLVGTSYFPPRIVDGRKLWGNQTDSGQNKLTPDKKGQEGKRAKERSRTYPGIAAAFAAQWG